MDNSPSPVVYATPFRLLARSVLLRIRRRLGLQTRIPGNERLSVVLLSYRRPKNLPHIVGSLLACDFVETILLSNHNPEIRMEDYVHSKDPRLHILNQPSRCYPSKRYDLALEQPGPYYLAIDDDVFLTPGQIRKLFLTLLENPEVPHGAGAEDFEFSDGKVRSRSATSGIGKSTDVILWAYAFTRQHLERYFELLRQMETTTDALKTSEDVVISFSGKGRPRCEDLGRLLTCGSSCDLAIASWRQDGFSNHRDQLYVKCKELEMTRT